MPRHKPPAVDKDEECELSESDQSDPEEEEPNPAPFDQELDGSDSGGEDDGRESSRLGGAPASSFVLSGGSVAFSFRSRNIFDQLDGVEKKEPEGSGPPSPQPLPPAPCTPPPQKKKAGVPDYLLHPERWTRYSLEEAPESSEEENRQAALSFLSGLKPRGPAAAGEGKAGPAPQERVVFCRPKRVQKEDEEEEEEGEEEERRKKKRLHLSHLAEEEEEEKEKDGQRDGRGVEGGEEVHGFSSFRKTKGKNYRRSSEQEEEEKEEREEG